MLSVPVQGYSGWEHPFQGPPFL